MSSSSDRLEEAAEQIDSGASHTVVAPTNYDTTSMNEVGPFSVQSEAVTETTGLNTDTDYTLEELDAEALERKESPYKWKGGPWHKMGPCKRCEDGNRSEGSTSSDGHDHGPRADPGGRYVWCCRHTCPLCIDYYSTQNKNDADEGSRARSGEKDSDDQNTK